MLDVELKNVISNTVLQTYSSGFISTRGSWVQYSYDFKIPTTCPSADIKISLKNALSASGGNDFYIDDITLEQLTPCVASDITTCPTGFLSIIQNNFEEFGISPNPSKGIFNIKLSTADKVAIHIFDSRGRNVFSESFNSKDITFNKELDLSTLSSGLYLMTVESDGKKETKKIIIE